MSFSRPGTPKRIRVEQLGVGKPLLNKTPARFVALLTKALYHPSTVLRLLVGLGSNGLEISEKF